MSFNKKRTSEYSRTPNRPEAGHARTLLFTVGGAIGFFALANAYSAIFFHGNPLLLLPREGQVHVLLNCLCSAVVAMFAWRVRGQIDYKIGQTIIYAVLSHGVLAFLILGGRWFFSRPLMMAAFFVSLAVGTLAVYLKHRLGGPRVAVIAPLGTDTALGRRLGEVITDPTTDLQGFDVALVAFSDGVTAAWARALSKAMLNGCQVRHIGEYAEEMQGAVSLEHFDIEHVSREGIASYRTTKRLLDLALVVLFGPALVSLALLGMICVLIGSGRPVFFLQERVGLGGKPFRMLKLRTMRPVQDGEAVRAAVVGDDRVTKVGRFLRRFRIDEIPQVWNVVTGEMSLIGPRPEATQLHQMYLDNLPNYTYRYLVRPGITGWAQVSAPPSASVEEARQKLAYDLFYVKRLSLYLDIQIVLRTFWTITSGSGVR